MIQLNAGTPVTLVLKAEDVQVIIQGLGEVPLKFAKSVEAEINRQLEEQFGKKKRVKA